MARVLALLTVAARFSVGEDASSSGDTGSGKLLWLNRPSFSALPDIALVMNIPGPCRLHGFQGCIVQSRFCGTQNRIKYGCKAERRVLWKSRSGQCRPAYAYTTELAMLTTVHCTQSSERSTRQRSACLRTNTTR